MSTRSRTGRPIHALAALVALLLVAVVSTARGAAAAAYLTDAAFNNLKYFGPTQTDSNWVARDMALVADYTWRLAGVALTEGQQCLFVNVLADTGEPDWKDGKLGTGASPTALLVGGGNIVIGARGVYNLTVTTPSALPNPLTLTRTGIDLYPTAQFAPVSGGFVQTATDVSIRVRFSTPCTTAALSTASFVVTPASAVTAGWSVSVTDAQEATVRFPALVRSTTSATTSVGITLRAGAVNATGGAAQHPNTAVSFSFVFEPYSGPQPAWHALYALRDDTDLFTDQKPAAGGWYVTPVHLQVLSVSGHVLVTGWSRRQDVGCTGFGSRVHGVSFVFNLTADTTAPVTAGSVGAPLLYSITPVNEAPRFAGNPTSTPVQSADVMYCSGHCALGDGRKLFVGGAEYWDVSTAREKESGLDYARIYDPRTNAITRVAYNFSGRAWYPTATLLPNGNILIARGFTDYNTAACTGDRCASPGLWLLDRAALDDAAGTADPWHTLVADAHGPADINPAVTDYTRTFVLPVPWVQPASGGSGSGDSGGGGKVFDVALIGQSGRVMLLATSDGTVTARPNAQRPAWPADSPYGCSSGSAANGALLAATGEILLIGPCAYLDLYNVTADTWRRLDAGIVRHKPAALLLPTGDVWVMNGENPSLDQSAAAAVSPQAADPRYPQLVSLPADGSGDDDAAAAITTFTALEPETTNAYYYFRGYHNTVALLKDGRILSGGGTSNLGGIGCEHSNMRMLRPPYLTHALATTARPALDPRATLREPWVWYQPSGGADDFAATADRAQITFEFSFPDGTPEAQKRLRDVRGAALLATSAFTHGSCQNQRYIELALTTTVGGGGADGGAAVDTATVTLPPTPALFPGEYLLFVVSRDGIPSVGKAVSVRARPDGQLNTAAGGGTSNASVWLTAGVLAMSLMLVGLFS